MARLELEIKSPESQLCLSNAVSASPKAAVFNMVAQTLKSEMLRKRKTWYFLKTLIEHWGRWQWERDEKQSPVQIKYFILGSFWLWSTLHCTS